MKAFISKLKSFFTRSEISTKPLFDFNVKIIILFAIAIIIKVIYFQYSSGISRGNIWRLVNVRMLFATIGAVLAIFSIFSLFFRKKMFSISIGINIFISLLLFCDIVYYRYYFNVITVPVLYQIGLAGSVGESVLSLIKFSDLIFIVDLPLIIGGFYVFNSLKKRLKALSDQTSLKTFGFRHLPSLKIAVLLSLISFICFFATGTFFAKSLFLYDSNFAINNLGVLYFHKYDVTKFVKDNVLTNRKLNDEEKQKIEAFYSSKKSQESSITSEKKYTGAAAGKNVIIVQIEALQQFVINRKLNGKEITPNLNKFMSEAAYFDNFYYQTGGGNTADAEFLSNSSLYPLKEGAVYFRFPLNKYYTLPKELKNLGYQTYVIHANNPSFWNRTEAYKAIGFDTFFSAKDFKTDTILGWGLSDKSMFRQTLQKIDKSKPFYSFFITLSTHHPFHYFENYYGFDSGEFNKTFLGNYLKAANYADSALGYFIDQLKEQGLYDNSILVIYGDHFGVQSDQQANMEKLLGHKISIREWAMLQKTPCFIRYPDMEQTGKIDTIGGEIDIMPTVANLMGIDVPYAFGKDLFNCGEGYVVLRNSSVITPEYSYINSNSTLYDANGNSVELSNNMDTKKYNYKKMQQALNISDIILNKDYFSKIEGEK